MPDGGVPTIGLPGFKTPDSTGQIRDYLTTARRVDPSNFYGTSSDFDNVNSDMATVRVEHDFKSGWRFTNTVRYGRTTEDYMLTSWTASTANLVTESSPGVVLDPSAWTLARSNPTNKNQIKPIFADQVNFSGDVKTGAIKHSISTGVEISREEQQSWGYYGSNVKVFNVPGVTNSGRWPAANLYNPDPNVTGYQRIRNGTTTDGSTTTVGVYLFDTIEFTPQWLLSAGLRADHYSTDYFSTALNATTGILTPTSLKLVDWLYTGKVGLTFKPSTSGSIYADFATGAQPPGGSNFALSTGAPATAPTAPTSIRRRPAPTRSAASGICSRRSSRSTGALYRTDVLNQVARDPTSLLYYQTGKQRIQGIELGLVGQITEHWVSAWA